MESTRMAYETCGECLHRRQYCRDTNLPVGIEDRCDRHGHRDPHYDEIGLTRMCGNCRRFYLRCEYTGRKVKSDGHCNNFQLDPAFGRAEPEEGATPYGEMSTQKKAAAPA